jgi:O-antigen ligase
MIAAHPLNGIGVRGFREAYPQFVADDDHWLQGNNRGAFHAHQWLLEVLAETGVLGLACWLTGLGLLYGRWRRASAAMREQARVPALAVLAALFPLNTHLALYSTFWSGVLLLLLGLLAGVLAAEEAEPRT